MNRVASIIIVAVLAICLPLAAICVRLETYVLDPGPLLQTLQNNNAYSKAVPLLIAQAIPEEAVQHSPFSFLDHNEVTALLAFTFHPDWLRPEFERLVSEIFSLQNKEMTLRDVDLVINVAEPKERFTKYVQVLLDEYSFDVGELPPCVDEGIEDLIHMYEELDTQGDYALDFRTLGCWPEDVLGPASQFYILEGDLPITPKFIVDQFPDTINLLKLVLQDELHVAVIAEENSLQALAGPLSDEEYEKIKRYETNIDNIQLGLTIFRIVTLLLIIICGLCLGLLAILHRRSLQAAMLWLGIGLLSSGILTALCGILLWLLALARFELLLGGADISEEFIELITPLFSDYIGSLFTGIGLIGAIAILAAILSFVTLAIIKNRKS
ncbi:MAG: hypothetical protein ABIG66_04650 [Candidatus Kerfeldbacteria bacterium]